MRGQHLLTTIKIPSVDVSLRRILENRGELIFPFEVVRQGGLLRADGTPSCCFEPFMLSELKIHTLEEVLRGRPSI